MAWIGVSWNQIGTKPKGCDDSRSPRTRLTTELSAVTHILINSPALGRGTGTHRKLSAWDGGAIGLSTPAEDCRRSWCVGANKEPSLGLQRPRTRRVARAARPTPVRARADFP
jgi:hypothetical protein